MLYTRCPDCQITYRITADDLLKADGKVRCGRCDTVFRVDEELHELVAEPEQAASQAVEDWTDALPPRTGTFLILDSKDIDPPDQDNLAATDESHSEMDGDDSEPDVDDTDSVSASTADSTRPNDEWEAFFAHAGKSPQESGDAAEELHTQAAEPESADEEADVDVDSELSPASITATLGEDMTAEQIDVTLSGDLELESRLASLARVAQTPEEPGPKSRLWVVGAVGLIAIFALQATHYFRAQLASQPRIGPIVRSAYNAFGAEFSPAWDLSQYEILDWIAIAEPGSTDQDTLSITARIRNNGPVAQPYPNLHLELKNRWEQTVGSRMFAPAEYLPADQSWTGLMAAGITIPARLDVADRTEDAYGFELDVCVDSATGGLECGSDATVFE